MLQGGGMMGTISGFIVLLIWVLLTYGLANGIAEIALWRLRQDRDRYKAMAERLAEYLENHPYGQGIVQVQSKDYWLQAAREAGEDGR
jgi:hypothetical protein